MWGLSLRGHLHRNERLEWVNLSGTVVVDRGTGQDVQRSGCTIDGWMDGSMNEWIQRNNRVGSEILGFEDSPRRQQSSSVHHSILHPSTTPSISVLDARCPSWLRTIPPPIGQPISHNRRAGGLPAVLSPLLRMQPPPSTSLTPPSVHQSQASLHGSDGTGPTRPSVFRPSQAIQIHVPKYRGPQETRPSPSTTSSSIMLAAGTRSKTPRCVSTSP